ncbi:hypothetical protein [Massilia sp. SYSU DXS3249]
MSANTLPGLRFMAVLAAANLLVACASPPGGQHARHHPGTSVNAATPASAGTSPAQGGMGGAMTQGAPGCGMMGGAKPAGCGGMRPMDKEAMCAMHRDMRGAPDEQARHAMMERHMQGMSPEMRQRHMEMMRQHCR